jgi:excisionase family DNA binding protein
VSTVVHLPPSRYRKAAIAAVRTEESAVYTVKEVARLLRLSLGGTYSLIRDGSIPAKKMGARWVIPKKRFHAWLDECTASADEATWGERR